MALIELYQAQMGADATKRRATGGGVAGGRLRAWRDMALIVVAWSASWALVVLAAIGLGRLIF